MNPDHEKIIRWIKERAERDYRDDVAVVLLYGSAVNRTAHRLSDVDCYFIPATPRAYEMSCTFIAGGVGYDLFPMSWERVGRIADLMEPLQPLVGDAVVLHARSDEDLARFRALGERMKERLADPAYRRLRAIERLGRAADSLRDALASESLHGVRRHVGEGFLQLSDAIALEHGAYFHRGLKFHFQDLSTLSRIPAGFLDGYLGAIRAPLASDAVARLETAIRMIAGLLETKVPDTSPAVKPEASVEDPDPSELVGFYEELLSSLNKLRVNVEDGDWRMAFVNGCGVAREIDWAHAAYGLPPLPFLDAYDADDLTAYGRRVEEVDAALAKAIEAFAPIRRYADFEAYLISKT